MSDDGLRMRAGNVTSHDLSFMITHVIPLQTGILFLKLLVYDVCISPLGYKNGQVSGSISVLIFRTDKTSRFLNVDSFVSIR